MKTEAEEKRDIQIIEKVHELTTGHKLKWESGKEGLTARFGDYDVVIRRGSGGSDILLIADELDANGYNRRHGISVEFATKPRQHWFKSMIDEIDHVAHRQHAQTDEMISKFLGE